MTDRIAHGTRITLEQDKTSFPIATKRVSRDKHATLRIAKSKNGVAIQ